MQKINYGLICEKTLAELAQSEKRPSMLLHVCCAPCSSSVLEYLEGHFDITLFFYNPNITEKAEFDYRLAELERFVRERDGESFPIIVPEYRPDEFFAAAVGLENEKEGAARCGVCYEMRLSKCAEYAAFHDFDFFTTTLSVSPYKNAALLCEIGTRLAAEHSVKYLVSDFKKKGGYQRSIELSAKYGLYRQNYCGCVFSAREAENRRTAHASTCEK